MADGNIQAKIAALRARVDGVDCRGVGALNDPPRRAPGIRGPSPPGHLAPIPHQRGAPRSRHPAPGDNTPRPPAGRSALAPSQRPAHGE